MLNREVGLINLLPLKRGDLLEGGGLFEWGGGGALNRGFTVLTKTSLDTESLDNDKSFNDG